MVAVAIARSAAHTASDVLHLHGPGQLATPPRVLFSQGHVFALPSADRLRFERLTCPS
jgi:hypothetical protein